MEKENEKLELAKEMQEVISKLKIDILEKEKKLDSLTIKTEKEN